MNRYHWYNEKIFLTQEVNNFKNKMYIESYATLLYKEKNIDEAAEYYLMAINANPTQPGSYIGYASLLIINKGRIEEAYDVLKRAEKSGKMSSGERLEWLNLMGIVKINQGKSKEALNYLFEAISIEKNPEVYNSICLAYMALKENDKALFYLKKGLELDAKNEILIGNLKKLTQ
jgi:tetratricopeptide (TPR) repeat protein